MRRIVMFSVVAMLAAACGAAPETEEQPNTGTPGTETSAAAVASTSTTTTSTAPANDEVTAGWLEPLLEQSAVPAVLDEQWSAAENQEWCSALYPAAAETLAADAAVRSANFGGGWAVAWDLPAGPGRLASGEYCADCGRGAFGVAGTGGVAWGDEPDRWPTVLQFADGSKVGYGFEGDAPADSGAPLLAYLLINNEGCNYNVWSFLGETHLVELISQLRMVEGLQGTPTPWQSQLPQPETVALGAAPWDEPALTLAVVPSIAEDEWAEAGSPASCPMLYFADLGEAGGARIRHASNEGEMLVAWDLGSGPGHNGDSTPCEDCGRGVIGLGTFQPGSYSGPVAYTWSDGSEARLRTGPYSYGVEAFVRVAGFECDYWVWSHLGEDHLLYLFSQLRRVEGKP